MIRRQIRIWLIVFLMIVPAAAVHAQWTSVDPPAINSPYWYLLAVHFPSNDEGWAVGSDIANMRAVIIHYVNGSWSQVTPPAGTKAYWLNSVYFTSKDEGWSVGIALNDANGIIFHYSNGTWTEVATPPVSSSRWFLMDVQFTSPSEGWAVGWDIANGKGIIFHYYNNTWTYVEPPIVSSFWWLYRARFTSPSEGWAVGRDASNSSGVFLHYLNGNWTAVQPNPTINGLWQVADVELKTPSEGWAVGGYYYPAIFRYSNESWAPIALPDSGCQPGTIWKVSFASVNEGWAVSGMEGNCARFYHYKDGQWSIVVPPLVSGQMYLDGIHFVTPNLGWAVGRDYVSGRGVILKYEIADNTPPTLNPVADKTILWPANHKLVDVTIRAYAQDDSGRPVILSASVTCNESVNGPGDGNTSPDWTTPVIDQQNGAIKLKLRAERAGTGSGRIYSVLIVATDQAGNSSLATVEVVVPHDKEKK